MGQIHEGSPGRRLGGRLLRMTGGLLVRGSRFLPLLALALAAASSLTAQSPGQDNLAVERTKVIEIVSRRLQASGMDGERANLTLRGVSLQGAGFTVRFLVDGVPIYTTIAMPVDLNATAFQGSFLPGQAIDAASEAQTQSNLDLLKEYVLRCVRREAGMQTAFRF